MKYKDIHTLGCSFSWETSPNGKNYTDFISEKLKISNVYNHSIFGSSNIFNYFKLYELYQNGNIKEDTLLVFQITFFHRYTFQNYTKNELEHNTEHSIFGDNIDLLHFSPHRSFNNKDIEQFNERYYSIFAPDETDNMFFQVTQVTSIYYFLQYIKSKIKNFDFVIISWEDVDSRMGIVNSDLNNLYKKTEKKNLWITHEDGINDNHLSHKGHEMLSDIILSNI